jgi:hypothetical protein
VQPAQHQQVDFGGALPSLTPAQEELVREALESTAAKRTRPRDPAAVSVDVDMDALTSLINDLREERSECSGASYAKVTYRLGVSCCPSSASCAGACLGARGLEHEVALACGFG